RDRVDIEEQNATNERKQQVWMRRRIFHTMIVVPRFSRLYRTFTHQSFERMTFRVLKRREQMRQQLKVYLLAVSLLLAVTSQAIGQQLNTLTRIDVPGASFTSGQGINPRGDIVGQYISGGVSHGFLLSAGQFASIAFPGSSFTYARGINSRGDIVG